MERLIAVCDNVPNTFTRRLGNETALFFARRCRRLVLFGMQELHSKGAKTQRFECCTKSI
jgi:hypothetical protein